MKLIQLSTSTKLQQAIANLVAILVRKTFTWHGGVFHIALMALVGSSLRKSFWPAGVLLGVAWFIGILWLANAIAVKNERNAFGIFFFALIFGGCGFAVGFF